MTTLEIKRWLNPWPIYISKNTEWTLEVETLQQASRYLIFHGAKQQHPPTAGYFVKKLYQSIQRRTDPPKGYDGHYIEVLARDLAPQLRSLTIIVDQVPYGWRIIDGNHRLFACLLRVYQKLPIQIKFVGVVKQKC